MKKFDFSTESSVICGQENNKDLFIRKVVFEKGYSEENFHNHPNSFEFYFILDGQITFVNENGEVNAKKNEIIYFEEAELHKIAKASEKVTMLLIKKIGSIKN